jgi:hypothetical protein
MKRTMSSAEKKPTGTESEMSMVVHNGVYHSAVELMREGRAGVKRELFYCPDANVLMWPKLGKEAKEGEAIDLTEISSIGVVGQRKGTGRFLKVIGKTEKDIYKFLCKGDELGRAWLSLLKTDKPEVASLV